VAGSTLAHSGHGKTLLQTINAGAFVRVGVLCERVCVYECVCACVCVV
jgi:hypothetical protein